MGRWMVIAVLLLAPVGCGSDEDDDSTIQGGNTGGSGTGGGGPATGGTDPGTGGVTTGGSPSGGAGPAGGSGGASAGAGAGGCLASQSELRMYPVDLVAGCVQHDAPQVVGCAAYSESGAYCARRIEDGAVFTTTHAYGALDSSVWAECNVSERSAALIACELHAACGGEAPWSACSLAETVQNLGCGTVTEVLDENCCIRPSCETSDTCDAGTECRQVMNLSGRTCRYEADGVCRCTGLPTGNAELHCLPIQ